MNFTFYSTVNRNYRISLPNGISDSFAILNDCIAKGIPTIVMHNKIPLIMLPIHSTKPPKISHNIFKIKFPILSLVVIISLPNGANCSLAILKH